MTLKVGSEPWLRGTPSLEVVLVDVFHVLFFFLGIEEESTIDTDTEPEGDNINTPLHPTDQSVKSNKIRPDSAVQGSINPTYEGLTTSDSTVPQFTLVQGSDLWWLRFWTLVKIRLLYCVRNPGIVFFRFVSVVFVIVGAAVQKFASPSISRELVSTMLWAGLYSDVTTQTGNGNPNMTYSMTTPSSGTGVNNSDFLNAIRDQNVALTEVNDVTELIDIPPHHMGVSIYDVTMHTVTNVTAQYNDTALHSVACVMNVISNALFSMLIPAVQNITTFVKPWPNLVDKPVEFNNGIFSSVILLGLAISTIPPGFGIAAVRDRQVSHMVKYDIRT